VKSEKAPEPAPTKRSETPVPEPPSEPTSPKKSTESADEPKKLKKRAGNTGLKGIFGKKKGEPAPSKIPTPESRSTSVSAAKATFEARETQPVKEATPIARPPSPVRKPATPPPVAAAPKAAPEPIVERPIMAPRSDTPPVTGREAEFDTLSRVDTNERIQAEREFASFDHQSPIVDQPAFVPPDSPVKETPPEIPVAPPKAPKAVAPSPPVVAAAAHNGETGAAERIPLVQSRLAQIRRNTAEREHGANGEAAAGPPERRPGGPERNGQECKSTQIHCILVMSFAFIR
jgi:hypothetical protein